MDQDLQQKLTEIITALQEKSPEAFHALVRDYSIKYETLMYGTGFVFCISILIFICSVCMAIFINKKLLETKDKNTDPYVAGVVISGLVAFVFFIIGMCQVDVFFEYLSHSRAPAYSMIKSLM